MKKLTKYIDRFILFLWFLFVVDAIMIAGVILLKLWNMDTESLFPHLIRGADWVAYALMGMFLLKAIR